MLYQLPTGKTIYLTLEQYLDLTDQDIQYLISINAGHYSPVRNPFAGSPIEQKSVKETEDEDQEDDEEDDFEEETPEEDFPEIPEAPPDPGIDPD